MVPSFLRAGVSIHNASFAHQSFPTSVSPPVYFCDYQTLERKDSQTLKGSRLTTKDLLTTIPHMEAENESPKIKPTTIGTALSYLLLAKAMRTEKSTNISSKINSKKHETTQIRSEPQRSGSKA